MFLAGVRCTDRSEAEDRIIIGCTDASIVLYDVDRKITQMTTAITVGCQAHLVLLNLVQTQSSGTIHGTCFVSPELVIIIITRTL